MATHVKMFFCSMIILILSSCQNSSPEITQNKDDWNWGNDKQKEQEQLVLMNDWLRLSEYDKALGHFKWLVNENPRLHETLYDIGLEIYDGLIGEALDQATKLELNAEREKIAGLRVHYFR